MAEYLLTKLKFMINGDEKGIIQEGVLKVNLGRIELYIEETILSDQNIELLKLWTDQSLIKFNVIAENNGNNILIEDLITNNFTFDFTVDNPIKLKNIRLLGNNVKFGV